MNKISITCTDLEAVGSLIKINDHWYDFKKQEESTMPFFSDRADIIVMIKCNTKIDSSPKKASKQIRIRKGSYGGRSRLSSRASIDQGQHIIELTLSVQHGDYTY